MDELFSPPAKSLLLRVVKVCTVVLFSLVSMRAHIKCAIVAFWVLPMADICAADKDKQSGRFGDLLITATAIEDYGETPHQGDHHRVSVSVRVKNLGKRAICASFTPRLRATLDLEYGNILRSEEPRMSELLPGEETSGTYVFSVKDGVKPLQLVLKPLNRSLRCGSASRDSLSSVYWPEEVRLDLLGVADPWQTGRLVGIQASVADPAAPGALPGLVAGSGIWTYIVETETMTYVFSEPSEIPRTLTINSRVKFSLGPKGDAFLLDEKGKKFHVSVLKKAAKQPAW